MVVCLSSHVLEVTNDETTYKLTSAAKVTSQSHHSLYGQWLSPCLQRAVVGLAWVDMGWHSVYNRSHAAPWGWILIWLSPRSDLLRGLRDDWWERARYWRLVTAHEVVWLHRAVVRTRGSSGYAPAACWAGFFGRLRRGGKLRPPEINPFDNCDGLELWWEKLWPHFFVCAYDINWLPNEPWKYETLIKLVIKHWCCHFCTFYMKLLVFRD